MSKWTELEKNSSINLTCKVSIEMFGKTVEKELKTLKRSKSGVYYFRNKFTNKLYVGMSKELFKRIDFHIWSLENNRHKSFLMQKEYNDYYYKGFKFDQVFEYGIIVYCRISELTFWENAIINSLHPEYNDHQIHI